MYFPTPKFKVVAFAMYRRISLALILLAFAVPAFPQPSSKPAPWISIGPDGGDARSFAPDPADPQHIYLGTTSSWIYETTDGGSTWRRLAKLSPSDNLIVDNLLVDESDPKTLYVGAWVLDRADGGIFISHDAGATWASVAAMHGQSVRALSQASSDPKVLVAGTLKGVFRSDDGGEQWKQISPAGSTDLHEVESIAIDPRQAQTIYAGTWHLPWKTTDGGASWHSIKQGLIDDSDVFSIIVDPQQTNVVYTSACSGIYKSENGGELYHKIQGIPSTARRTRVLMQDPTNAAVVYAGTTEGLYKTTDAGAVWKRMTGPDVIINDVHVDPRNSQHLLLATDRSGVLSSTNGGVSFASSNSGFSERQVATLIVDRKAEQTFYAGVINDKTYGGVFVSHNYGRTWAQQSDGLEGRDVFSLAQSGDGSLWAGTNDGLFLWSGSAWQREGKIVKLVEKTAYVVHGRKRTKIEHTDAVPQGNIEGRVNALSMDGGTWVVTAATGVYTSQDQGAHWQGGAVDGKTDFSMLSSGAGSILAAERRTLALSQDTGKTWQTVSLPQGVTWMSAVAIEPGGSFWIGAREGVFFSQDHGQTWQAMTTLPISDISALRFDPELQRIIVSSSDSTWVLGIDPSSRKWKWWDPGWYVRNVNASGDRLLGTTMYNGVVIQPAQGALRAEADTAAARAERAAVSH